MIFLFFVFALQELLEKDQLLDLMDQGISLNYYSSGYSGFKWLQKKTQPQEGVLGLMYPLLSICRWPLRGPAIL